MGKVCCVAQRERHFNRRADPSSRLLEGCFTAYEKTLDALEEKDAVIENLSEAQFQWVRSPVFRN